MTADGFKSVFSEACVGRGVVYLGAKVLVVVDERFACFPQCRDVRHDDCRIWLRLRLCERAGEIEPAPGTSDCRVEEIEDPPSVAVAAASSIWHHLPHATFCGRCYEVVDEHIIALPDAVKAPHSLFEPHKRPRDVPVHKYVGALQVDSFAAGVSRHKHLELTAEEAPLQFVASFR